MGGVLGMGEDIKSDLISALIKQNKEIHELGIKYEHDLSEDDKKNIIEIDICFDDILDFIKSRDGFSIAFKAHVEKTISDCERAYSEHAGNTIELILLVVLNNYLLLNNLVNKERENKDLFERNLKITDQLMEIQENKAELERELLQARLIKDDLKNKRINEIFEDDSRKFKYVARVYEISFYSIVIILILYFLGLTFYVNDFKFLFIEASFPEKIHGKLSPEFYIQKVSLLILSTTLAAFLLKRSFMNRRLADDAYRTAKELDALPRYMEGMSEEMKEKIRFDLAYKYFGNGIHHESYTGGENLMHENIKANTDFIRAVKDLTPKAEMPKTEKFEKAA